MRPARVHRLLVAGAALALTPLAGCAAAGDGGGAEDRDRLTVLAATSLTDTFTDLAAAFEERHPGVEVTVSFGSSATLAQQVADGAPGDVLATADEPPMQQVVDAGAVIGPPLPLATNELALVTPPDDPAGVDGLADLDRGDVELVTCVATAPCGSLADTLLADAGVDLEPVSEEIDVKAVLARVVAGEADAGVVYRTDALAAGDRVSTVPLPPSAPRATLPVALLADSEPARDFVDLLLGQQGQEVLARAGFGRAAEEEAGGG